MFLTRIQPKESPFHHVGGDIFKRIEKTLNGSFDVFFGVLSSTHWKSPREIAANLIAELCPKEWSELKDNPEESLQIRREKETVRIQILYEIGLIILHIAENPTIIQENTTRFLIKSTLADMLAPHDQDRILAAELLVNIAQWKALLKTLAQHGIVTEDQRLQELPYFHLSEAGETACAITVDGHIETVQTLPHNPLFHDTTIIQLNLGDTPLFVDFDVTKILLSHGDLQKYGTTIHSPTTEQKVRDAVYEVMRGVPVYKKRGLGNRFSGGALEGELKTNTA